jgi:hypothetical protein
MSKETRLYKQLIELMQAMTFQIKEKKVKEDLIAPPIKQDPFAQLPQAKPIDPVKPVYSSNMDEKTSPASALNKALERLRDRANEIEGHH